VTETKKGRLSTSRITAISKQKGNIAVIYWQSADFPPNQQIAVFSIKCLL
jgi:hypothetical protein